MHRELLEQGDTSYSIRRFQEECQLLSQIRHPNIVQFLGVHFHDRNQTPILVMEFLPTNLTYCIETYGTFHVKLATPSCMMQAALGSCALSAQSLR